MGLGSPRSHHRPPTTLTVWTWEWTPVACIRASLQLPPLSRLLLNSHCICRRVPEAFITKGATVFVLRDASCLSL